MADEQVERSRVRRRSRAEADQVAAEFEASGLTRREFCEQRQIPINTLARYVARRRRAQAGQGALQRWVAVEVAEGRSGSGELAVVLLHGRRIEVKRGFDGETLRRLVVELERT